MVIVSPFLKRRMWTWQVGGAAVRAVRDAVDHQAAAAADAFAAVGVERDRILAFLDELFVDDIQHLEERHVGMHVVGGVVYEPAGWSGPACRHTLQSVVTCHVARLEP